jgi:O-antigen/teichoic acid export membrane protein
MLRIIPTAIGSALFPSLNSLTEEEATIRIPFIFRRLLVITLPTVLLFALLAYPMVELFYSAKFLATLPALYMILPGMAFLCVATPFSIFLSSPRYIRLPNLSAAIAAVITIILDILLIPRLGIVGAAMASSLSYMALVITLIIFYLKITKTRLGELFRFHGDEFMVYKQLFEIIVKTVRR